MTNKIKKLHKPFISFTLFWVFLLNASAIDVPSLSNKAVHDEAHILKNEELESLEKQALDIDAKGQLQLAVLIVKSLEGLDIESYAMKVFETWKLGRKNKDNGVLILIAYADRAMRIELGYGLEAVLTDSICSRIVRNSMAPNFQNNNYFLGLSKAIHAIEAIVEKGNTEEVIATENAFDGSLIIGIIICFILIVPALSVILFIVLSNKTKTSSFSHDNTFKNNFTSTKHNPVQRNSSRHRPSNSFSGSTTRTFSGGGGRSGGGGVSATW